MKIMRKKCRSRQGMPTVYRGKDKVRSVIITAEVSESANRVIPV
jgi:hypothetical protein